MEIEKAVIILAGVTLAVLLVAVISLSVVLAHTKAKMKKSAAKVEDVADDDTSELPCTKTSDSLLQALDISHVGIAAFNHEQQIIYSNKVAPVTKHMDDPEQLGLCFEDGDGVKDWVGSLSEQVLRAERIWKRIPGLPNNEGERAFYDVIATYEAGNYAEVILVIIDRSSTYGLEESDLNFIAFAAHELRSPITTIRGYLDVLKDELGPKLAPEHKELFDRMVVSSNKLSSYINNILNVSSYDKQHLQLNLKEESLQDIFNSISDDVMLRAKSHHRNLHINIGADLPTVAADTDSLGEVFTNLIDNAIKYSFDNGDVNVVAEVDGDHVLVRVIDNGIGIPASIIGDLFKKFYRSHRSRQTIIGTGIGLYISKAIVQSHGGTVSVSSSEGKGATFTVSLPTYASQASKLEEDGSNATIIREGTKATIKNHGTVRG